MPKSNDESTAGTPESAAGDWTLGANNGNYTEHLYEQGAKFWDRFETTNQLHDLDKAIGYYRQAFTFRLNDSDHIRFLYKLGLAYEVRFITTDAIADLEQAISHDRQILEMIQVDNRTRSRVLSSMASHFMRRFARTSEASNLETAFQYTVQALKGLPEMDSKTSAKCFYDLGHVLYRKFKESGHPDDLKHSIITLEYTLQCIPARSTTLGKCSKLLGDALNVRYEENNDPEDLEHSIRYYKQALEAMTHGNTRRMQCMYSLGLSYLETFYRHDQMVDLERSIQYLQQALEATPLSDISTRAACLADLAGALFYQSSEATNVQQSIEYFQQALAITSHDHPEYVGYLSSLGVLLFEQYRRTNQRTDLDQSIEIHQKVLQSTSTNDHRFAEFLSNLGMAYGGLSDRTWQNADLDQSIEHLQRAVDVMSVDYRDRPRILNALGTRLVSRYRRTSEMADLDLALDTLYRAIKHTVNGFTDGPIFVDTLVASALAFLYRFNELGYMDDINNSIKWCQWAVDGTREDNPQKARNLLVLGYTLDARSELEDSIRDLKSSTEAYQKALSHSVAVPWIRVLAGRCAVDNLLGEKRWNAAADVLSDVLQVLPDITLPTNSRYDMQHLLGKLSNLASLSASVYLKAGKSPLKALQALEQARGIIASFLIDARSEISVLKEDHPELWSQYTHCQQQIGKINLEIGSAFPGNSKQDYATKLIQRQRHYKSLEELRDRIRQCAGFERFLLPLTEDQIRELARPGPVICFNVSEVSSEAFLITTTDIQYLPLPDLKIENIQKQVSLFASRGNPARRDGTLCVVDEAEVLPVADLSTELQYVWVSAVKPVLQQTGLLALARAPNVLPRIWWVGGGIMSLLPLHAAGNHTPGSSENTLSHAISSFAPTLKSLQFIRTRPPIPIQERKPELLIVSMPTTPGGYKSLDVAGEVTSIAKYSDSLISINHLAQPNKEAVLNALKSCTIAHFACHGSINGIEPAKSALIVGRDTAERLTIADLDTVSHENAQIVYLSACSTAETQALELQHESIHLASAFQLSGFQHVIGTLWGADDGAAVQIASNFYRILLRDSYSSELSVAQALHDAVLCFRNTDNNYKAISLWAPFIHLGC